MLVSAAAVVVGVWGIHWVIQNQPCTDDPEVTGPHSCYYSGPPRRAPATTSDHERPRATEAAGGLSVGGHGRWASVRESRFEHVEEAGIVRLVDVVDVPQPRGVDFGGHGVETEPVR